MTFRIDGASVHGIGTVGERFWCWRVKGIDGRGVYGSIVSDREGCGLYVAEGSELLLLLEPDWHARLRCLMPPHELRVPFDLEPKLAIEVLAAVLKRAGWGPRVDQRGQVMATLPLDCALRGHSSGG